jgi:hypothetical protein
MTRGPAPPRPRPAPAPPPGSSAGTRGSRVTGWHLPGPWCGGRGSRDHSGQRDASTRYPRHDRHRRRLSRSRDGTARPPDTRLPRRSRVDGGTVGAGAARGTGAAAGLSHQEYGRTLTAVKDRPGVTSSVSAYPTLAGNSGRVQVPTLARSYGYFMSRRKALDGLDAGRGIDDYLGTAHFATNMDISE